MYLDDLKKYCDENELDPKKTRVFVGEDVWEPKCYGIYKDGNGDYFVYKNRADGVRVEHYRGFDEEYAVHEIVKKLSDVMRQNGYSDAPDLHDNSIYERESKEPETVDELKSFIKTGLGEIGVVFNIIL